MRKNKFKNLMLAFAAVCTMSVVVGGAKNEIKAFDGNFTAAELNEEYDGELEIKPI